MGGEKVGGGRGEGRRGEVGGKGGYHVRCGSEDRHM